MSAPGPTVSLLRHGETEWSRSGQHTGRTDLELTRVGEEQARAAARLLDGPFDLVLTSPRRRARCTAELAGVGDQAVVDDDLVEWDYGEFEGLTTPQIQERVPGWSIWDGPWPGGETAGEVAARADRVVERVRTSGASRVLLVAHGHILRVLAARWLDLGVGAGRHLALDTAAVCLLGWEHDDPAVRRWNLVASGD